MSSQSQETAQDAPSETSAAEPATHTDADEYVRTVTSVEVAHHGSTVERTQRSVTSVQVVHEPDCARDKRVRAILQNGTLDLIEMDLLMGRGWSRVDHGIAPNHLPSCVRETIVDRLGADSWAALLPEDDHDWERELP